MSIVFSRLYRDELPSQGLFAGSAVGGTKLVLSLARRPPRRRPPCLVLAVAHSLGRAACHSCLVNVPVTFTMTTPEAHPSFRVCSAWWEKARRGSAASAWGWATHPPLGDILLTDKRCLLIMLRVKFHVVCGVKKMYTCPQREERSSPFKSWVLATKTGQQSLIESI